MRRLLLAAACATISLISSPSNAATVTVDDSNPLTITITVTGFNTFFVAGNPLANNTPLTLADGAYSWSGSWNETRNVTGLDRRIGFGLPTDMTFTTSGVRFVNVVSDGTTATFDGGFRGYVDPFTGNPAVGTLLTQDSVEHTVTRTIPNASPSLTITFTSEAVPEPATLSLLAAGLLGLAAARRRKSA